MQKFDQFNHINVFEIFLTLFILSYADATTCFNCMGFQILI